MNILIVHSATSKLVKELMKSLPEGRIYVLTFPRNKGLFSDCAQELFFEHDDIRINTYQVYRQVQKIIEEKRIERVIGVYGNLYGSNYENLRVLFSKIRCNVKEIYNRNMELAGDRVTFKEKLIEFYYSHEQQFLPWLRRGMKIARLFRRRPQYPLRKIMFINNTYTIGGIETLLLKWGERLAKKYQVVCVCDTNGGLYPEYQKSLIKTYLHREKVFDEPAVFAFYGFLRKVIRKERPDAIIMAGTDTIIPATCAAALSGVPYMIKMFNGRLDEIQNSRPTGLQMRKLADIYDAIVAVSASVMQELARLGINEKRIKVIYGSTVEIADEPLSSSDAMLTEEKIIACISRLSPEKGVDVFLQAIACLNEDNLDKVRFVIAGDGPERDRLEALAVQLDIAHRVSFLGFCQDTQTLIRDSFLTVLSSHTEGLPVVVLETMANGKVCIASRVGGTPELVEHGVNGFLFPDNDYRRLAELIEYCLGHESEMKVIGDNARETLRKRFHIEAIMVEWEKLFEQLYHQSSKGEDTSEG